MGVVKPVITDSRVLESIKNFGTNNVDEASLTLTYVGKEDADGVWIIQKIDTSSGTAITYATNKNNSSVSSYSSAWTNRETLVYSLYNDAF